MTESVIRIPTLETERLRLRAPVASDFEPYAEFCASERSSKIGGPFTRDQAFVQLAELVGHWPLRGFGRWVVADKKTDEPFGVVGLMRPEAWPEPEIAWKVFANAEGKGIAMEAAIESRRYAYEVLGWSTVISATRSDNIRSAALAQRMGATQDGSFEHPDYGTLNIFRHLPPEALQ